jgi:phosphoserine phosphatase RsbU/P
MGKDATFSTRRPGDTFAGFLTGESNRDQRNIDILLDTIAEVSTTIDLNDLLVSVVDKTLEFTGAERGILMLFEGQTAEAAPTLQVRVARDSLRRDLPSDTVYSRSVPEKVAREGSALCLIDAASRNETSLGQSIVDLRLLTVMCVPLKVKDNTIGVLYVDSKASSREFTDSDLMLFKALSFQLAIAIENARLVNEALEAERLQQSLLLARDIQKSLLPPGKLSLKGYDIYGLSRSCDETGGDYFDYIRVRDGHLGLVIGDVSGHGISAALYMATARALMRAFASTEPDPSKVFHALNNSLERDMGTGRFMTLFYGDLDIAEGTMRYVRAGHNEPLLYRAAEDRFDELRAPGMALGFVRDYEFEVAGPVMIDPGDILILYTDGIPEARDASGEQYGMERFEELLRAWRTRPAEEIVDSVVREVAEFTGSEMFEDDVTLIVIKATGDSTTAS